MLVRKLAGDLSYERTSDLHNPLTVTIAAPRRLARRLGSRIVH